MRSFTKKQVRKAIIKSRGVMSVVADRLGCDWSTAKIYVDKFKLSQQMADEDERMCDFAESQLFKKIKIGETACIIFYLKTKGRRRGYTEHHELSGEIQHKHDVNMEKIIKSMNEKR